MEGNGSEAWNAAGLGGCFVPELGGGLETWEVVVVLEVEWRVGRGDINGGEETAGFKKGIDLEGMRMREEISLASGIICWILE